MIRAGIIPKLGDTYCFGIDSKYKTIMDFGGHKEDVDSDLVETAIRECREESLGIFDLNRDCVLSSPYFSTSSTLYFIVDISGNIPNIDQEFAKRILLTKGKLFEVSSENKNNKGKIETCNLLWLTRQQLTQYLQFPQLFYEPVYEMGLQLKF